MSQVVVICFILELIFFSMRHVRQVILSMLDRGINYRCLSSR